MKLARAICKGEMRKIEKVEDDGKRSAIRISVPPKWHSTTTVDHILYFQHDRHGIAATLAKHPFTNF